MRLLLIEDELKTTAYLTQGFQENGYLIDTANNGHDGLRLALSGGYDLMIFDVMVPGIDGWSILREVRRSGSETPVMFLTARDSVADRVNGLELGADDYLIKPFAFAELLARTRTLLRRPTITPFGTVCIEDLTIDHIKQKVVRSEKPIDLTPKEFLLLSLFVRRPGEVLSRSVIAKQVWDMNFDSGTNNVDVAVRRLRRKVDDPFSIKLIHTVHGVGYVFRDSEAQTNT